MNFKPLALDDFETLKVFFADQPYNLSIYSLSSLIAWSNQVMRNSYTIRDGSLLIAGEAEKHPEEKHLLLPISTHGHHSPSDLYDLVRTCGFDRYSFVPGDFIEALNGAELSTLFITKEQIEFEDYVYLTDDLIRLKGNKFSKKRNLINQFTREYLRHGRISVESIRSQDVQECLEFLDLWCEQHECEVEQESNLACEKNALTITLNNLDRFESKGILIRVDGAISAFGIGSRLNDSTGVLNFEKAFSSIKGLYQFLDNECAKRLFSEFRYVNKESDLNLPNLAESKLSYNPVFRVKSFTLIVR
jgi:uncharacterized protein